ncbi:hypothetical protein [Pseudomonas yamanorum]|uniref:hypothetical protein n=1 Tax=Pseudomonas yamanorum TaxID=515393 RepID=UPI002ED5505F|nr:hypothetical protein VYI69_13615 [Pseudomonas yamanorum]
MSLEINNSSSAIAQAEIDHVTYFNFAAALRGHFRLSGCFPNAPDRTAAGCISENFRSPPRASPDSYLWPASHISWTVFFADRLAWFRVLTSGEHGQFQSWRGDRIYCSRCAHCWGSICEVPVLLKSGGL